MFSDPGSFFLSSWNNHFRFWKRFVPMVWLVTGGLSHGMHLINSFSDVDDCILSVGKACFTRRGIEAEKIEKHIIISLFLCLRMWNKNQ